MPIKDNIMLICVIETCAQRKYLCDTLLYFVLVRSIHFTMAASNPKITCPNCTEDVQDEAEHITRDVGSPYTPYYWQCKGPKKCSNCGYRTPASRLIAVTGTRTMCCTAMCLNDLLVKTMAYKDEHFTPKPRIDSSTSDEEDTEEE